MFGIVVLASVAIYVFFDPNEYRDEISAAVKESTGRDLTIEGDLSLSLFPWLAIEVGRTELGNAEGFGDQPFLEFEAASLSIRLMPLILMSGLQVQRLPFIGESLDQFLPSIITQGLNLKFFFGGTALLIVVGVAMDTVQQIESQLIMRHYEGFLKGTRIRGRRG